jgi:hypothetical protein
LVAFGGLWWPFRRCFLVRTPFLQTSMTSEPIIVGSLHRTCCAQIPVAGAGGPHSPPTPRTNPDILGGCPERDIDNGAFTWIASRPVWISKSLKGGLSETFASPAPRRGETEAQRVRAVHAEPR